jgi:hypothetical protein
MSKPLGGFVSAHNEVHGDEPMFSSLKAPEDRSLKPAGAEYWHLWTVVVPRLSMQEASSRGALAPARRTALAISGNH